MWRAHHHALVLPAAIHHFLDGGLTVGDSVVTVDVAVKAIVIGTIDRRGAVRACAIDGHCRQEVEALQIPALLRGRRACLQQLEVVAFSGIRSIKM